MVCRYNRYKRQYKMTVGDPVHMIPVLAICDPEITIGLPKSLTAACGVDALTHCIEAYTVQLHQPITDALALKGISMIAENLEKAYENGEDREARRNMMIASTIGGMAFISSNVGAVHAFAETVGAWFDTPHGVAIHCFCHISWNLIFRHVLSGLQILRMQWESKEKKVCLTSNTH